MNINTTQINDTVTVTSSSSETLLCFIDFDQDKAQSESARNWSYNMSDL